MEEAARSSVQSEAVGLHFQRQQKPVQLGERSATPIFSFDITRIACARFASLGPLSAERVVSVPYASHLKAQTIARSAYSRAHAHPSALLGFARFSRGAASRTRRVLSSSLKDEHRCNGYLQLAIPLGIVLPFLYELSYLSRARMPNAENGTVPNESAVAECTRTTP